MNSSEIKAHWGNVYKTKNPDEVSWTQEKPEISLKLIRETTVPTDAKIIDVRGR